MTKLTGVELARKTLAHIEELERRRAAGEKLCQHWDQTEWGIQIDEGSPIAEAFGDICGTAMCFAGWACHLAGEPMVMVPNTHLKGYGRWYALAEDGQHVSIGQRAAELLGDEVLDDDSLFDGGNDLDRLRLYVERLEAGTYPHGEVDDAE